MEAAMTDIVLLIFVSGTALLAVGVDLTVAWLWLVRRRAIWAACMSKEI